MDYQLYPFRLYKSDKANRKFLEKHWRKMFGKKIDFSIILRTMMELEVKAIQEHKVSALGESISLTR